MHWEAAGAALQRAIEQQFERKNASAPPIAEAQAGSTRQGAHT